MLTTRDYTPEMSASLALADAVTEYAISLGEPDARGNVVWAVSLEGAPIATGIAPRDRARACAVGAVEALTEDGSPCECCGRVNDHARYPLYFLKSDVEPIEGGAF